MRAWRERRHARTFGSDSVEWSALRFDHGAALVEQKNAAISQTEPQANQLDEIIDIFATGARSQYADDGKMCDVIPGRGRQVWPGAEG